MKHASITREYLLHFLKKENLATLSTIAPNNKPDAATIHYIVKDNFDFFFLTKKETAKYKNMEQQNEVVLTVTNALEQETIKIRGKTFPVLDDPEVITDIVTTLAQSKTFIADLDKLLPIIKRDAGEIIAIKIIPYEIRASRYKMTTLQEELFYFDKMK